MKNKRTRSFIVNLLGFFVARASFYGMNPLAIGYFTAVYLGNNRSPFILVTIFAGLLTTMHATFAFKYLLTMILTIVILDMPIIKKRNLSKAKLYGLPSLILGVFTLVEGAAVGFQLDYMLLTVLEVVIAHVSALILSEGVDYLTSKRKGMKMSNEQMISIGLIIGILVFTFPELSSDYIAAMESIIYFLVLFIAYKYGAGAAAVAGALGGFSLALRGGPITDLGMLTMMSITASIFRELGRVPTAVIFNITGIILGILSPDMALSLRDIGALLSASLVFLILPKSLAYQLDTKTGLNIEEEANEHLKKIANRRIEGVSDSFSKLSKVLDTISEKHTSLKTEEINDIFESISERLCKNCDKCIYCWEDNFDSTYQAANTIFEIAEKNGEIKRDEAPDYFIDECMCVDQFLSETNRGFELAKINYIWNSRLTENREVFAEQLKEVSGAMKDMTDEWYGTVRNVKVEEDRIVRGLREAHVVANNLTIIQRKDKRKEVHLDACVKKFRYVLAKDAANIIGDVLGVRFKVSEASGTVIDRDFNHFVFVEKSKFKILTGMARTVKDTISGDNFSQIKLETGNFMMALSDGMGTGEKAGDESEEVLGLLEQLIESGFKAETAIKLINSSMVLKADNQMFSTLDMCLINLFTGICEFVKIGAATTFIKRDNWVETISSTTIPIGMLGNVDYDGVMKKLYEGDIIIMVTDGVLDSIKGDDKEEYLKEKIMAIDSSNPQELANRILDYSLVESGYKPKDDMTILTAGIWHDSAVTR